MKSNVGSYLSCIDKEGEKDSQPFTINIINKNNDVTGIMKRKRM